MASQRSDVEEAAVRNNAQNSLILKMKKKIELLQFQVYKKFLSGLVFKNPSNPLKNYLCFSFRKGPSNLLENHPLS